MSSSSGRIRVDTRAISGGWALQSVALPRIQEMDNDEEESFQRQCVDCRAFSPSTQTAHTLISSTHGWRLERTWGQGQFVLAWRCPRCWKAHHKGAGV
jgi:hypothetical protein